MFWRIETAVRKCKTRDTKRIGKKLKLPLFAEGIIANNEIISKLTGKKLQTIREFNKKAVYTINTRNQSFLYTNNKLEVLKEK